MVVKNTKALSKRFLGAVVSCVFLIGGAFVNSVSAQSPSVWDGDTNPTGISYSGSGTQANPYIIDSAAKLAYLRNHYKEAAYSGRYFKQTVDIDLNNRPWEPIGGTGNVADANFVNIKYDGDNHTISNLYINKGGQQHVGLFSFLAQGSVIENLTLSNVNVYGGGQTGALVGRTQPGITANLPVLRNITVASGTVRINKATTNYKGQSGGEDCGGIAGRIQGNVYDCVNHANVIGYDLSTGGIAGICSVGNVERCENYGAISSSQTNAIIVGGILGANTENRLVSCVNYGTVSGKSMVGGIVGENNCGANTRDSEVSNNINLGSVSGTSEVGGICGHFHNSYSVKHQYLNYNVNYGSVSGTSNVGGIAGRAEDDGGGTKVTVNQNLNNGTVSGTSNKGEILGSYASADITNNFYDLQTRENQLGGLNNADVPGKCEGTSTYNICNGTIFSSSEFNKANSRLPIPNDVPLTDEIWIRSATLLFATEDPNDLSKGFDYYPDVVSSDFFVSNDPGYTWTCSPNRIDFVDGKATIKSAGTVTVTCTYGSESRSFVLKLRCITKATVTLSDNDLQYNCDLPVCPTITKVKLGATVLDPVDYTANCSDNTAIGIGKITVQASATGKYDCMNTTKTFNITGIDMDDCVLTVDQPIYLYTGYAIEPSVSLTHQGNVIPASDYTVSYSNNTNPGTATVTVTPDCSKGYAGTISGTFKIKIYNLEDAQIELESLTYPYTGMQICPDVISVIIVDGSDIFEVPASSYDVSYDNNVEEGDAEITITANGSNASIVGSLTDYFTIVAPTLEGAEIMLDQYVFYVTDPPTQIRPTVIYVMIDDYIVPAEHYTVSYTNNVNVGTATVTVTAKASSPYSTGSSSSTTFTILQKIANGKIKAVDLVDDEADYDGCPIDIEVDKVYYWPEDMLASSEYYWNGTSSTFTPRYSFIKKDKDTNYGTNGAMFGANVSNSAYTLFQVHEGYVVFNKEAYELDNKNNVIDSDEDAYIITYLNSSTGVANDLTNAGIIYVKATGNSKPGIYSLPTVYATNGRIGRTPTFSNRVSISSGVAEFPLVKSNSQIVRISDEDYAQAEFTINRIELPENLQPKTGRVYRYNGLPQQPVLEGFFKDCHNNQIPLVAGKDYGVTGYSDNVNAGTNTAYVDVQGIGNFSGTASIPFSIEPRPILDGVTLTGTIADQSYTGSQINWTSLAAAGLSLKLSVGNLEDLVEGVDFTVEYINNVNPGVASIKIIGIGNYTDTRIVNFNINVCLKNIEDQICVSDITYTGSEVSPVIRLGGCSASDALLGSMGEYTVNPSSTLINAGNYTLTLKGTGSEFNTSAVCDAAIPFTIDQANLNECVISGINAEYVYTGSAITPTPVLKYNGLTVPASEYTVSYSANTNCGTVSVNINATSGGNFKGSTTTTFAITQASLTVTLSATNQTYDGTEKKAASVVASVAGLTERPASATSGGDYTITYTGDLINVGTVNVAFNLVNNNYVLSAGSVTTTSFNILPANFDISLSPTTYAFDRTEKQPALSVTFAGTSTPLPASDYQVLAESVTKATNVGSYTVKVKGSANFSNVTKTAGWSITSLELKASDVVLSPTTLNYNGSDQSGSVGVTVLYNGSFLLTKNVDYTVTMGAAVNVGTYTITVQGIGNYTGTVNKTYQIVALPIKMTASIDPSLNMVYKRTAWEPTVNIVFSASDDASNTPIAFTKGVDYNATVTYSNNTNATFHYDPIPSDPSRIVYEDGGSATYSVSISSWNNSNYQLVSTTTVHGTFEIERDRFVGSISPVEFDFAPLEDSYYSPVYTCRSAAHGDVIFVLDLMDGNIYDPNNIYPGFSVSENMDDCYALANVPGNYNYIVYTNSSNKNYYDKEEILPWKINKKAAPELRVEFDPVDTFEFEMKDTQYFYPIDHERVVNVFLGDEKLSYQKRWVDDHYELVYGKIEADGYTRPVVRVRGGLFVNEKVGTYNNTLTVDTSFYVFPIGTQFVYTDSYTIVPTRLEFSLSQTSYKYNTTPQGPPTVIALDKKGRDLSVFLTCYDPLYHEMGFTDVYQLDSKTIPSTYRINTTFFKDGHEYKNKVHNYDNNYDIYKNGFSNIDTVLTWVITKNKLTVTPIAPSTFVYDGSSHSVSFSVKDEENREIPDRIIDGSGFYNVQWVEHSSSVTTAKNVGTYYFVIDPDEDLYNSSRLSAAWTITAGTLTASIKSPTQSFTYDGNPHLPTLVISDGFNRNDLVEGVDYTLEGNTAKTDVGTYTIRVMPSSNYVNTPIVLSWQIVPATLTASLSPDEFTFDGSLKKPTVIAYRAGSSTPLIAGVDYYLSGDEQSAVNVKTSGSYAIKVIGMGNYNGSEVDLYWDILPAELTATVNTISDQTYTGSAITPTSGITFRAGGVVKSFDPETDYNITAWNYSNNISVGSANVQATIQWLNKNYSLPLATANGSFKIVGGAITAALDPAEHLIYDGTVQSPTVIVKFGDVELTENVDYVISGTSSGTNAGSYNLVVSAKAGSNYVGTVSVPWSIAKAAVSYSLADISNRTYTGSAISPTPALTFSVEGTPVAAGFFASPDDYTVVYNYANNTNVGTATATAIVTWKSIVNYTLSTTTVSKNFEIVPAEFNVTADATTFAYTGSAQGPTLTVKFGTTTLASGTDYELSGVQTATDASASANVITVTGKGNFAGCEKTVSWYITKALGDGIFSIDDIDDCIYDDVDYTPAPIVRAVVAGVSTVLTKDVDYTVSYTNHHNAGTATVSVVGKGNYDESVTASRSFTILPRDISILADEDFTADAITGTFVFNTLEHKPTIGMNFKGNQMILGMGTGASAKDYTVTYENNVNASTTDNKAKVVFIGHNNFKGTRKIEFSIERRQLDAAWLTLPDDKEYTGASIESAPKLTFGSTMLVEDTDFEVSYLDNVNAFDVPKVTVTGIGNYKGELETTFDILPVDLASSVNIVIADIDNQVYTGASIMPGADVKFHGAALAISSTTYDTVYVDNLNIGVAKLTIKAKTGGNFINERTKTFNIVAVKPELIIADITAPVYTGSELCPTLSVTANIAGNIKTLVLNTDYEIVGWHQNINACNDNSAYVEIRGINNISSDAVATKYFNIAPRDINDVLLQPIASKEYTASAISPDVVMSYNSMSLVKNADYTVAYDKNVNVFDTPEITIKGIGNYTNERSTSFAITPADLATVTVTPIANQTFTGDSIKPATELRYNGLVVNQEINYTVGYANNINVGTAIVTFAAKETGNFTGNKSTTFTIDSRSVELLVAVNETSIYNGTAQRPSVTVTAMVEGQLKTLTAEDFDVEYFANINASETAPYVSVVGKGNFEGSAETIEYFVIKPRPLTEGMVKALGYGLVYTGSTLTPIPTMEYNGMGMINTADFKVSHSNNINATKESSMALATIVGLNNYTDTLFVEFSIDKANIANAVIAHIGNKVFTGSEITPEPSLTYLGLDVAAENYSLSYDSNINVGEAVITITAEEDGNFFGETTTKFNIVPVTLDLLVGNFSEVVYTGSALTPSFDVTVNKGGVPVALTEEDYEIVGWSNNVNAGINTASVTVRGKRNYSAESVTTQNFSILQRPIEEGMVVSLESGETYTGAAHTPVPQMSYNEMTLVVDNDITLAYNDNINAFGSPTVIITGVGNYTGSIVKNFTIAKANLEDVDVDVIPNQAYTGTAIEPTPMIRFNGNVVDAEVNYTVRYVDNVEIGTANTIIEAKEDGNFTGSTFSYFRIEPAVVEFIVKIFDPVVYNTREQKPELTVSAILGGVEVELENGIDYIITEWNNNINAGTASVTLKGKGRISAESVTTANFTIDPCPLTEYMSLPLSDVVYSGYRQTPIVSLLHEGSYLRSDDVRMDFEVEYLNNIKAFDVYAAPDAPNKPTARVSGLGNYTGSVDLFFTIKKANLADATVADVVDQFFTGVGVEPTTTLTFNGLAVDADYNYDVEYQDNINVGEAQMIFVAKDGGNFENRTSTTFKIVEATAELIVSVNGSFVYTGSSIEPTDVMVKAVLGGVEYELVQNVDYILTYSNNVNAGSNAVVKAIGMGNYSSSSIGQQFFTISPCQIVESMMTAIADTTYTGREIRPIPILTYNGMTLVNNTDFNVSYTEGTLTNAYDIPRLTINGVGNYNGSILATFDILPADIVNAEVDPIGEVEYTGLHLTPERALTYLGLLVVKDGNYTVSHSENNVNIGTAQVIFTAIDGGNFVGTKVVDFEIVPVAFLADVRLEYETTIYDSSAKEPRLIVTRNSVALEENVDYTVAYDNNIEIGQATVTVSPIGNYNGESVVKTFSITAIPFVVDVQMEYNTIKYSGLPNTPTVTVTKGSTTLVEGLDYKIVYIDNVEIGTASVILSGIGHYEGSMTLPFTITLADFNANIELEYYSIEYMWEREMKPAVTVSIDGKVISTDNYDVAYLNNTRIGDAMVVVTAKNHYQGVVDTTFQITPINIARADIEIEYDNIDYSGYALNPSITSIVLDGRTLTKGVDFIVSYDDCVMPGTAKLIAHGMGFYGGEQIKEYNINAVYLDAKVTLEYYTTVYDSKPKMPMVTVEQRRNDNTTYKLTEGIDYTIDYLDNVDAGTATVVVNSKGIFSGDQTELFEITKALVKVTVKDITMIENTFAPDFEIKYDTLYGGLDDLDTEAVATVESYYYGQREIVLSGASAKNYEFEYINGILNVEDNGEFLIWPNPVRARLYVKGIADNSEYTIVSMTSADAIRGVISSRQYIDLHRLACGLYVIKVDGREIMFTKRK